jgi:superfamily II DNA or RNA helicase
MKKEALLEINNNKIHIEASSAVLNAIREADEFRYRNPNAFHMRKFMPRGWDGYMRHLSDAGYMPMGLFPRLIKYLDANKYEYEIDDLRKIPEFTGIPTSIGGVLARDYQDEGVRNVVTNYVGGIYFPRGIINAAPNAGKTHIMMALHKSFKKARTLILLKDSSLFDQFLRDMPKVFKEKEWGYIRGKNIKWGPITIAMAQTLTQHVSKYKRELEAIDIMLIDECDQSNNKTIKNIVTHAYNATVRVGLSGTVFKRKLAKDRTKNEFLYSFFGEELLIINNKELMDRKISAPIVVKISIGNRFLPSGLTYDREYHDHITASNQRNQVVADRVKFYLNRGKTPILVACTFHEHVELLYDLFRKKWGLEYKIDYAHVDKKDKAATIERFRTGEIDILVASKVVNRGQNLPLIKVIINAAGGDGPAVPLQLLGRGSRIHESKTKTYFEDFMDAGDHLMHHSKHRLSYYKAEGFKIILLDGLGKKRK